MLSSDWSEARDPGAACCEQIRGVCGQFGQHGERAAPPPGHEAQEGYVGGGVRDADQDVQPQPRQPRVPGPQLRPHQGPAQYSGEQPGQYSKCLGLQSTGGHIYIIL